MSEESSNEVGEPFISEAVRAELREYRAQREREYADALRQLEDPSIEPAQEAAYLATLTEMLALPTGAVAWPSDDPRWRLHRAIEYGDRLAQRRADIERRFAGRLPPEHMYAIGRYALAALHAFKVWRGNPEPEQSFARLVKDAAHLRDCLRSNAVCFQVHNWIAPAELRPFDGGVSPESIACDLFLLAGVLQNLPPERKAKLLATPVHLLEATVFARSLMQHVASKGHAELWEPRLLYARAYTLVDHASFHAELVLSEFHNVERDPYEAGEWRPECLFCNSAIERQRHVRASESPDAARRRAQFVSATMTSALIRKVVVN